MRTKQILENRQKELLALNIVRQLRELVEKCEDDPTIHFMVYAAELQSEEVYNQIIKGEVMN